MPRAVVLVHGIRTSREDAEMWGLRLGEQIRRACPDVLGVHLYEYGFLSAFAIRFPWVGGAVRRRQVGRFQRWVAALSQRYGGDVELDGVGYSFGTYLIGRSMTDAPGPRSFWGRLVLMGSILSARDDWSDKTGHYARALNLFSAKDEVVHFSTFGQSGWAGFLSRTLAPNVRQMDVTPAEHEDYKGPGVPWDDAVGFLATD